MRSWRRPQRSHFLPRATSARPASGGSSGRAHRIHSPCLGRRTLDSGPWRLTGTTAVTGPAAARQLRTLHPRFTTWRRTKPAWFTDALVACIATDMLPVRDAKRLSAQAPGGRAGGARESFVRLARRERPRRRRSRRPGLRRWARLRPRSPTLTWRPISMSLLHETDANAAGVVSHSQAPPSFKAHAVRLQQL